MRGTAPPVRQGRSAPATSTWPATTDHRVSWLIGLRGLAVRPLALSRKRRQFEGGDGKGYVHAAVRAWLGDAGVLGCHLPAKARPSELPLGRDPRGGRTRRRHHPRARHACGTRAAVRALIVRGAVCGWA